jgi:hypothetical protein
VRVLGPAVAYETVRIRLEMRTGSKRVYALLYSTSFSPLIRRTVGNRFVPSNVFDWVTTNAELNNEIRHDTEESRRNGIEL